MSLLLWLPLIDGTENQGLLGDITPTYKSFSIDSYGKIGKCHKGLGLIYHFDEEILGNQWTLTTWVKVESWGTANNILFCKNISGTDHCQFYLSIINGRVLNLGVNGGYSITTYSYTFETNKWYHISATYDGSNYVLYINGDVVKRGIVTNPLFTDCVNLGIGQRSTDIAGTHAAGGGNDRYYNDVRIYDTALSPREIKLISQGLALHYPMSRGGFGQDNLIKNITGNAATEVLGSYSVKCLFSQNKDTYFRIRFSEDLIAGQNYTISMDASGFPSSSNYIIMGVISYNSGKNIRIQNGHSEFTFSADDDIPANTGALFDDLQRSTTGYQDITITNIKLEKGSIATPWTPNPTDSLYTALGLDDNIEYDVSGYQRNGIRNNITYSGDTPRYNGSYVFNGTSSYVMTNDASYVAQAATEFTVNEWAYADDWSIQTGSRLWSCTENAGFNTQTAGGSKLTFPINAYTAEDFSSRGWVNRGDSKAGFNVSALSPGWHMFTGVYTTSKITTYIDGVLHETNNQTSYGIYFHPSVCMFLGTEATIGSPIGPYFNGKLSDFRLYYTALSADDILDLYNTPTSLSSNGTLLTNSISEGQ